MNAFGEILEKLAELQDTIKDGQQNYNTTISTLDNKIVEKRGLISELETKIDGLKQANSAMIADLEFQRNSLDKREQDISIREQDLMKRENDLKKEIEDERKVSFVKATQAQLKDKIDELDIIQKQLAFYKKQCELLTNLTMKYCLNHEQLTIEMIEEAICNRLGGGPATVPPQLVLEVTALPTVNKKSGKPTKKQLLEEEKRKAEALAASEKQRMEEEAKKLLEAERLRLEEEAKQEEERLRLEEEAAQLEAERLRLEEEAQQEAEPTEEEGEEVYVEDFTYKGVLYYLDKGTGEIYSRLENDEVGEVVGILDSKGKVKITKKK